MVLTPKSLAEVLLKVWALTLTIGALVSILGLVAQFFLPPVDMGAASERVAMAFQGVYALLSLIAGITLLKFSADAAEYLAPAGSSAEPPIAVQNLEVIAFGILGAILLVEGLRDLSSAVFQLATKPVYELEAGSYLWRQSREALVGAGVQTIAGLALLLGRQGIASFIIAIRKTPTPRDSERDSDASATPRSS
jgi:hypothetical protein